jgi:LPXTG-motif cell wall-anchored protein
MPVVSAGETPQGVQTPWFTQPGLLFVLGGLILLLLGVFLFFRGRSKK